MQDFSPGEDLRPAPDRVVTGRLKQDAKALALIVPAHGIVFISVQNRRLCLSLDTDEEIRRGR
jgi:hypothetical protein